jgi:type IV pilus assembly protein PilQ
MTSILAAWVGLVGLVPSGTVTDVSILPGGGATEVVIAVSGPVQYRDFVMDGPTRLVVDLMGATLALPGEQFAGVDRGGVRAVRTSQYEASVVRVVLELHQRMGYQVEAGPGNLRITLESGEGAFEPWSSAARAGMGTQLASSSGAPAPPAADFRSAVATSAASRAIQASTQEARRISVQFTDTPIQEVLFTFAEFSGRSIVPSSAVSGTVNAEIRNQPWDIAMREVLISQGLAAAEDPTTGIIRVDNVENITSREQFDQLITRAFPISYASAEEVRGAIEPLLSERGRVSVGASSNTLVVMDIGRVQEAAEALIQELDIQTPMISISAKIIFVNRTDLDEFGVTYDLKDSRGNQLNQIAPGAVDQDGDGIIRLPDEQVDIGTDVVSLGGSSVAALGNANSRVAGPSLSLLTSLVLGRHTLISFIEALQSVNLSDVEASPSVSVLDNHEARILVGERTPIRVIDAQAGGAGGGGGGGGQQAGGLPQATVRLEETGIGLRVTPHVTQGNKIRLTMRAERSAAEVADSDVGLIFRTQEAESQVLVQDGETVVIGGLTVTERSEVRSGIPLLMNLPVVGRFFRTSREQQVQRDLMILVTPTINRPVGN